jgi:hypothetical protein
LAEARLDRIDEDMIAKYPQVKSKQSSLREKPYAVATINRELATLRRILRLAQE